MSKFCHVLSLACPNKLKISKKPQTKTEQKKTTQENPRIVKLEQKCNVLAIAHVYKKRGNDTLICIVYIKHLFLSSIMVL